MKKERNIVSAEVFEPLDALCTNKDRTRVAVVGRTVTKVYQIFDNHFELRSDRSKPRKTMYFSGSIAWSQLKDNLIAAASSNGAIYVWDPESPQTMESYYKAHKQLATKVCFNEFNEHILVSGSKDSTVWLYDLRMAEPTTCFASNQDDSIRDIQFCMESKNQDTFVTAGDSGTIRFWDARKPDKALKEFIAHSSQVYSIALNPQIQSKNLIATAGRDKYIRIWDWSKSTPHYFYTVEMMAIVTRVSWHVACCFAPPSGFVSSDNTIYVWDIRRPYIPFASFDAHTKTCTDMSWPRYGNCPSFLSCGKDGKLIMNFIDNAHRPILYANTVAINAQSPLFDEIFVAVPSYRRKSSSALVDQSDPFRRKVPSTLFCTTPTDPFLMDGKALAYFGMNYKFIGASIDELCAHNGRVAEYIFKDRLAYAWRMVALLCAQTALTALRPKFVASSEQQRHFTGNPFKSDSKEMDQLERRNPSGERKPKEGQNGFVEGGPAPTPKSAVLISGSLSAQHHLFSPNMDDLFFGADELNLFGMNGDSEQALRSLITSGILSMSQLKEEAFDLKRKSSSQKRTPTQHGNSSALQRRTRRKRAESMANGLTASSSIWGTFQRSNRSTIEEDEEPNEEENEEKATPVAIGSSRSTPSSSNQDELDIEEWEKGARGSQQQLPPPTLPTNFDEEPTKTRHKNGYHQQQQQQEDLLKFDPLPTLKALLQFYSNLGDVQMCATVCMVVGERILEKLFSMEQIELWFNAYIELLERLKLWHVASLLIKACYRPKISQLSNESTFVKTWCRNCRNPATKASMRCAKCRQLYNYTCILCETTVRGIWSSCAECGHGGHLQHMEEWFGQSEVCPAVGCGHHCARTSTAV